MCDGGGRPLGRRVARACADVFRDRGGAAVSPVIWPEAGDEWGGGAMAHETGLQAPGFHRVPPSYAAGPYDDSFASYGGGVPYAGGGPYDVVHGNDSVDRYPYGDGYRDGAHPTVPYGDGSYENGSYGVDHRYPGGAYPGGYVDAPRDLPPFGPGNAFGPAEAFDPEGFGAPAETFAPREHETVPRGIAAHDALTYGVTFRGATSEPTSEPGPAQDSYGTSWEFEEGLARLLGSSGPESPERPLGPSATEPPARPLGPSVPESPVKAAIPRQRVARRRPPRRATRVVREVRRLAGPRHPLKVVSLLLATLIAVVVAVVGVLSGVVSYDPIRRLAVPGAAGSLPAVWPLLVYGPWLAAALSILRAAVHRRRAAHSWAVVVLFSALAVCLCVAGMGRDPVRLAVAGLPPIAALVCFHQLVRQITLTVPPRKGPHRPRPHRAGRWVDRDERAGNPDPTLYRR